MNDVCERTGDKPSMTYPTGLSSTGLGLYLLRFRMSLPVQELDPALGAVPFLTYLDTAQGL